MNGKGIKFKEDQKDEFSSVNEVLAEYIPKKLTNKIEEFFIDYYGESKYRAM